MSTIGRRMTFTSWIRAIIRFRYPIILAWAAVAVLGLNAMSDISRLLSDRFSVPGADSEVARKIAKDNFGERSDGTFTIVFEAPPAEWRKPAFVQGARRVARRAAGSVKGGRAGGLVKASRRVTYAVVKTPLELVDAQNATLEIRRAMGRLPGANTYLSGTPAVNHDTTPIVADDLRRGEMVALPIALVVLVFMFGTLVAVSVPLLFAFTTVPGAIGIAWIIAHHMNMPSHVTNLIVMIGIAIAIDYSMLIVFRYREELATQADKDAALVRTMLTAGRTVVISGFTVAIGLAVLVLLPLPFMRALGIAGLLIPLVSILAAITLLPALLAVAGRSINRVSLVPVRLLRARAEGGGGFWSRLSRSIMRRPVFYLIVAGVLMLALATPALGLKLTGGDFRDVPLTTESTKGMAVVSKAVSPGVLAPHILVVDTGRGGGVWGSRNIRAQRSLAAKLRRDREVTGVQSAALLERSRRATPSRETRAAAERAGLVDSTGRYLQMRVAGRHDMGTEYAKSLVHRLRESYVPVAGFSAKRELVGGSPAIRLDFVDRSWDIFPLLVLGALVISYILLVRAFRSIVLPLKAVFMNLLSISAAYGVLVLVFEHGVGEVVGLESISQVEAWIPIFLFAMLFGLSMDYEVFMLTRMREEWDRSNDNTQSVAMGLERTGRIVTAAAVIMVAAFTGFTMGSFVSLQEFGLGLSAAIFLDATVVRALLVPATMKLLGRWNWYLPGWVARVMRIEPSPLAKKRQAALKGTEQADSAEA